jgi:hypothetical protein
MELKDGLFFEGPISAFFSVCRWIIRKDSAEIEFG